MSTCPSCSSGEAVGSSALSGGWVDYIYTAPDEDGRYLVWLDDMITVASYEDGQFQPDAGDEETITHWAKISAPNAELTHPEPTLETNE